MTENMMCMWSNKQTCKFTDVYCKIQNSEFKNEYCTFCMKGKLINEIAGMNKKLDQIIISMKK